MQLAGDEQSAVCRSLHALGAVSKDTAVCVKQGPCLKEALNVTSSQTLQTQ
jgi:hypothetical protein